MIKKIAIASVLILFASKAASDARIDRSIDELVLNSSSVVSARIFASNGDCGSVSRCHGYEITLEVSRVFVGQGAMKEATIDGAGLIKACSLWPLTVNFEYVLFLEPTEMDSELSKKCQLVVAYDGAFLKIDNQYYREGSVEGVVQIARGGTTYVTSSIQYEDLLEELTEAISNIPAARRGNSVE